ncbi:TIR domain-containing protein [Paractinoplanes lichenicola]|uniref:TIR domain-containing protein n=1 Tax=Paractinoplanes lichenicola TaxID=2802976 RepID=A0ABS1VMK1_9ACTN|nr:TIR domain-containing protein [Actinoplanes lichenicola]MBL7255956.1 TIR domain-containing protein [Actinoplanes lichenicola]
MSKLTVEDVFKISGVPTHTFVKPSEFSRLMVALRTPGRGVVVEGPSGIGKSTAVTKVLDELEIAKDVVKLSARIPSDVEYIELLPELGGFGTVIVDDFHRLDDKTKAHLADLLKVTADQEDTTRKLVIIGINDAGRALIKSSPDLSNRIDVVKFEIEPDSKIGELVAAGENALNVRISAREHIIEKARGSFYLAQLLCMDACVAEGVIEKPDAERVISTSFAAVQRRVVERQKERFGDTVRAFARGTKFRPSGRAPYLHILKWLSESDSWSISLSEEMRKHPTEKVSVSIVLDQGYLKNLTDKVDISEILHFDPDARILAVENPMLIFYLRNVSWPDFVREVGFTNVDYRQTYDFALSFAGEDRSYAEHLRNALEDNGHTVFYDFAEQHRFLGQDIEAYMGPIYASDSRAVVVVLGDRYGRKRWTLFEASQYKSRIEAGEVIPIWSSAVAPSPYDEMRNRGGLEYDPLGDLLQQATSHADALSKMIAERSDGSSARA